MKAIAQGQSGPAVEDVQQRLVALGHAVVREELDASLFGPSTLAAVRAFRSQQGLAAGDEIDEPAWIELVDASYHLGDRTLYLRLPYFHGADVGHLQMILNVLGFPCGAVDGHYGPHTEAAVREFQSNVGLLADGIAFQDTFDAIERLHHVWSGKTASPEFSVPHMGLARTVDVLENYRILVEASDPIARSVASRVWNVACATTCDANVTLIDYAADAERPGTDGADLVLTIATAPLPTGTRLLAETPNITVDTLDIGVLTRRFLAVAANCDTRPLRMRIELSHLNRYDGSVDGRTVQTAAIALLDAVCAALSR